MLQKFLYLNVLLILNQLQISSYDILVQYMINLCLNLIYTLQYDFMLYIVFFYILRYIVTNVNLANKTKQCDSDTKT